MTTTKKFRLLQEWIDNGLGDKTIIEYQDYLAFISPARPIGDDCIREIFTIADLKTKMEEGNTFDDISFKDIVKAVEKGRVIRIGQYYKDSHDKLQELYDKSKEKKVGDIYNEYAKNLPENEEVKEK